MIILHFDLQPQFNYMNYFIYTSHHFTPHGRMNSIPTRVREEKINQHPRPIIAKVSFFKDKQQIKSHIKHLPKGKKFGVADDFPKEVDKIRKELYPVLKRAKRDHKTAFFNVEKLIIDKAVYREPETKKFTLYSRIMDNI